MGFLACLSFLPLHLTLGPSSPCDFSHEIGLLATAISAKISSVQQVRLAKACQNIGKACLRYLTSYLLDAFFTTPFSRTSLSRPLICETNATGKMIRGGALIAALANTGTSANDPVIRAERINLRFEY